MSNTEMTPEEIEALMDEEYTRLWNDPRLTDCERELIFYGLFSLEEVLEDKGAPHDQ